MTTTVIQETAHSAEIQLTMLARQAPATDDLVELADWLAAHGAAHLSAIERIELADWLITRRRFLIGAGALALGAITGCSAPGANAPTDAPATTRRITHARGDIDVPTAPQRIVSVSLSTTGPLLALGAPVIGSQGSTMLTGTANGLFRAYSAIADERGVGLLYDGFEPNLEAIAAAQPDLIIGSADDGPGGPAVQVYEQLTAIAPTALFNVLDRRWQDILVELGAATGYAEAAEARLAEYAELERDVKATITLPPQPTSLVTQSPGNPNFFLMPPAFALAELLSGVGFSIAAPSEHAGSADWISFSSEVIAEYVTGETMFYVELPGATPLAELRRQPLWANLSAIRAERAYSLPFEAARPDPYVASSLLQQLRELFA